MGYPDGATLAGEPFSARTLREDTTREREFTPLKDKLGQSFFEDLDSSEDEGMPTWPGREHGLSARESEVLALSSLYLSL